MTRCNLNTVCSGAPAKYAVTERPWRFWPLDYFENDKQQIITLFACDACKIEIEKRAGGGLVDDYCRRCGCHILVKREQFKRPGLWNTCRVCAYMDEETTDDVEGGE